MSFTFNNLANGVDSNPFSIWLDNSGNLWTVGWFGSVYNTGGSIVSTGVGKYNIGSQTWSGLDTGLHGGLVTAISIMGDNSGNVYVGGWFTHAGSSNITVNGIAKWNGSAWSAMGTGFSGGNAQANKVLVDVTNGYVYVSGDFTSVNSVTVNNVARWNGTTWSALGSGLNNTCPGSQAMCLDSNNNLYVVGTFTSASGVSNTSYIAMWNGTSWSALGTGLNAAAYVLCYDPFRNLIYVMGDFTTAGGISASHSAIWNINRQTWQVFTSATVNSMCVSEYGNVLATIVSGSSNFVAEWDRKTDTWNTIISGLNNPSWCMAALNNNIFYGGPITLIGATTIHYIAETPNGYVKPIMDNYSICTNNPLGTITTGDTLTGTLFVDFYAVSGNAGSKTIAIKSSPSQSWTLTDWSPTNATYSYGSVIYDNSDRNNIYIHFVFPYYSTGATNGGAILSYQNVSGTWTYRNKYAGTIANSYWGLRNMTDGQHATAIIGGYNQISFVAYESSTTYIYSFDLTKTSSAPYISYSLNKKFSVVGSGSTSARLYPSSYNGLTDQEWLMLYDAGNMYFYNKAPNICGVTGALNVSGETALSKVVTMPNYSTEQMTDISNPQNGMMLYNSTTNQFEGYINSAWNTVGGYVPDSGNLSLSGQLLNATAISNTSSVTSGSVIDVSSANTSIILPNGTTGQRPTGAKGMLRYNTTSDAFEGYSGSTPSWGSIGGGGGGVNDPVWSADTKTYTTSGNFVTPPYQTLSTSGLSGSPSNLIPQCATDNFAIFSTRYFSGVLKIFVYAPNGSNTWVLTQTYTTTYEYNIVKCQGNNVVLLTNSSSGNACLVQHLIFNPISQTLSLNATISTTSSYGYALGFGSNICTFIVSSSSYSPPYTLKAYWYNSIANTWTNILSTTVDSSSNINYDSTYVFPNPWQIVHSICPSYGITFRNVTSGSPPTVGGIVQTISFGSENILTIGANGCIYPIYDGTNVSYQYMHVVNGYANGGGTSRGAMRSYLWSGSTWSSILDTNFTALDNDQVGYGVSYAGSEGTGPAVVYQDQFIVSSYKQTISQYTFTKTSSSPFLAVTYNSTFLPIGSRSNKDNLIQQTTSGNKIFYASGSSIYIFSRVSTGSSANINYSLTNTNLEVSQRLEVVDGGYLKLPVSQPGSIGSLLNTIPQGAMFIDATTGQLRVYTSGTWNVIQALSLTGTNPISGWVVGSGNFNMNNFNIYGATALLSNISNTPTHTAIQMPDQSGDFINFLLDMTTSSATITPGTSTNWLSTSYSIAYTRTSAGIASCIFSGTGTYSGVTLANVYVNGYSLSTTSSAGYITSTNSGLTLTINGFDFSNTPTNLMVRISVIVVKA